MVMGFYPDRKRCPKCKKLSEWVIVEPVSFTISGSYYCWNCHIYIDTNGKEDKELMAIMLEVYSEEDVFE